MVQTERGERDYDPKNDPLFLLKPVKFKQKIKSSEIDRFLYHVK
jgi:hypothetical protein